MREKEFNEGLGDMADAAERDHEVQMARADCYKIAKYAIKLHDMLKNVSEAEGLEGWVQSKITKAADYLGSVYHHLDYEEATGEINDNEVSVEKVAESKSCNCDENCPCGGNCGPNCDCHAGCSSVSEGKFKSAMHRKAVHAAKASGKRSSGVGKKLRRESLQDRLNAKLAERTLTKGETKKKEKYVKGMKKAKGDFKKRYGKDAESVMYATATKMAKD